MAELGQRSRTVATRGPPEWDAERIARALVPRRDYLVTRLPRELAAARGLTHDQHELVIDEAIDFMVTEYGKPIADEAALERAFWATAAFRVRRVHERRGETVRAGWQRVGLEELDLAAPDADPISIVVRKVERGALVEFAATLSDVERRVLSCKYGDERFERGWRVIAKRLDMSVSDVRRTERSVRQKLERFVAIVSAGSLCTHRGPALEALAAGLAGEQEELLARLHLENCSACRLAYAEHMRALRGGELQHRIAQLLPLPPTLVAERRRGGPLEAVADWVSRPFGSESVTTGAQLAAGARGIGAIAATKLAAMCIGGVVAIGGSTYCATTLLGPEPPKQARKQPPPPSDRESRGQPANALSQTTAQEARNRRDATGSDPSAGRRNNGGKARSTHDPKTQHERDVAVSPPVQAAPTAGTAEFEPAPASSAPETPAAAPATGAPEFP